MSCPLVKAVLRRGPVDLEHRFALMSIATFARSDGSARVPVRALLFRMGGADPMAMAQVLQDLIRSGWMTRESQPTGSPVYQLDLGRLGIAPPQQPVPMVRRAIGSVQGTSACEHCGAALSPEPTEGTTQQ